ncbi:SPOSA6832_02583, partial [Sporobolomyces salmonicolor]
MPSRCSPAARSIAHALALDSAPHGHVLSLTETIAAAARETGAEVDIYRFPEILSDDVRAKLHAAPHANYPEITPDDLLKYDGFLFGAGGLWAQGKLVGKMAGIYTSSASQHGGQETTALTTLPFFAHHGIIYVPIGFASSELTDLSEIVGGSAWGAAAIAGGDGSRAVSDKEAAIAKYQGSSFAKTVAQFVAGKAA